MSVRVGADPYIGVGRRDRQLADAGLFFGIGDAGAIRLEKYEPFFGQFAGYAMLGVTDVAQLRQLGGLDRIERGRFDRLRDDTFLRADVTHPGLPIYAARGSSTSGATSSAIFRPRRCSRCQATRADISDSLPRGFRPTALKTMPMTRSTWPNR